MTNAVPVIDLSQYFVGDQQAKAAVASGIADACEHRIGFFKVVGHGVQQAVVDDAFATADRLLRAARLGQGSVSSGTQRLGSRLSRPCDQEPRQDFGL